MPSLSLACHINHLLRCKQSDATFCLSILSTPSSHFCRPIQSSVLRCFSKSHSSSLFLHKIHTGTPSRLLCTRSSSRYMMYDQYPVAIETCSLDFQTSLRLSSSVWFRVFFDIEARSQGRLGGECHARSTRNAQRSTMCRTKHTNACAVDI